ncbi:ImmA/IrrE family metallo-endopeptidase [Bdellovibrio sp. HCB290]|uniref:ImmA/IrrE family metallo-endopeptidase n=1 Tax=Bdellovibrio sp. HCB290 TaxID=3394356 RepID=UPI0039B3D8C8
MATKSPEVPINPLVLAWARKSLRLSVEEAAELIGINVDTLQEWENGLSRPSFAQLKKVGNSYKRSTAVFLLPRPPEEAPVPKDFRVLDDKTEARLSPSTFIEIRKAQKKRDYALEMIKLSGQEPPTFKWKLTLENDPEEAGKAWRKRFGAKAASGLWKSEYDALNFWKNSIEDLGVLVFQASLQSVDELRGLAVYHTQIPIIMLNTKDSPRGRIFSLLHEFCHLLLQKSGIGNMEPSYAKKDNFNIIEIYCNAFAAACLLPIEELASEPGFLFIKNNKAEDTFLKSVAKKYQVSWDVVLRRLLTVGKISQSFFNSKRTELRELYDKQKKKENGFVDYITKMVSQNGEPFIGMVLDSISNGHISVSEASDFLGIKANHFPKLQTQIQARKRRA